MSLEASLSKSDADSLQASTPLVSWLSTWAVEAALPLRIVDHAATRDLCNNLLRIASQERKQVGLAHCGPAACVLPPPRGRLDAALMPAARLLAPAPPHRTPSGGASTARRSRRRSAVASWSASTNSWTACPGPWSRLRMDDARSSTSHLMSGLTLESSRG